MRIRARSFNTELIEGKILAGERQESYATKNYF